MDDNQLLRYSRQIMLPDLDIDGQETLLGASALIVGMGGLGCPVALYLAAAGVGKLLLADDDKVDLSNLQRQIAHGMKDIGRYKTESVCESIAAINPDIEVDCLNERLTDKALAQAVSQVDIIIDCSDNFGTRFELNAASQQFKIPLVSGAAIRWEGQLAVYDPRCEDSPCYRCLYEETDDEALSCSESGVVSPLVGIVASMQALEAIKVLTHTGTPLVGKLVVLDTKTMEWRQLQLAKRQHCPVCSV